MATKRVAAMTPGIHYSVAPEAQAIRRARLEPDKIREELRRESKQVDLAAIGMIRSTEYLQCSDAERIALIDRILDILDEVTAED